MAVQMPITSNRRSGLGRCKSMKRTTLVLLAALAMLFFGARQSYADGITYTVSDIASGSFNAMAFTDALVTVVALGDTSNVFPNPKVSNDFDNNVSSATVTISGFGTFTLLGPGQVFDFQAVTTAGITYLGFFPG